ncbi:hypothetical protein PUN28_000094 [Cardiocondyla obscurior]|uniref:Uncharacterized protein n=1 Tax=Cardiocondyla obscurior TaxID=286306 RepID=A0AAW2GXQ6_9HYME
MVARSVLGRRFRTVRNGSESRAANGVSVYRIDTGPYLRAYPASQPPRRILQRPPRPAEAPSRLPVSLPITITLAPLRASCTCIRSYRLSHALPFNYSETPRKSIPAETDRAFLMHIHLDAWRRQYHFYRLRSVYSDPTAR